MSHASFNIQSGFVPACAVLPMTDPTQRGDANAPDPNLDEARLRQQAIGVKLRQMFDEIVQEPVPDEFLDILRRADDKAGGAGGAGSGGHGA